jgi:hypothetical protein
MKKTQRKINKKVIYKSRKHSNRKNISKSVKHSNKKYRTVKKTKQKGGDNEALIERIYNGFIGDIENPDNFMIDDDTLKNISDYILSKIETQNNTETYTSIVNGLILKIKNALGIQNTPQNNELNNVKKRRTHVDYIEKKLRLNLNSQALIQNLQLNVNKTVSSIVDKIYEGFFLYGETNNTIKTDLTDADLESIISYISHQNISPVYTKHIIEKLKKKSKKLGDQLEKYIYQENENEEKTVDYNYNVIEPKLKRMGAIREKRSSSLASSLNGPSLSNQEMLAQQAINQNAEYRENMMVRQNAKKILKSLGLNGSRPNLNNKMRLLEMARIKNGS